VYRDNQRGQGSRGGVEGRGLCNLHAVQCTRGVPSSKLGLVSAALSS